MRVDEVFKQAASQGTEEGRRGVADGDLGSGLPDFA